MAHPAAAPVALRTISARRSLPQHIREIRQYRELLGGLIRKELKVRYKNSVLGFVWSMVQPIFLLVVYSFVFSILGAGFKDFSIWLLCGLIIWTLIITTLSTATQAITANAYLVSKVSFPRVILPLASLGSALVHLLLQLLTLAVLLVVVRHGVAVEFLWLLPIAVLVTAIVCAALGIILSVFNVFARDTQHLLELLLTALFWATPVVYQYERAANWFSEHGMPSWLPMLNPFTPVVITFQRAVYGLTEVEGTPLLPDESVFWYLNNLLIVGAVGTILLVGSLVMFDRAEGNFAEVL